MKKLLMLACLLLVLPLMVLSSANATNWYYLTQQVDHDSGDTLKIIGKPPEGFIDFSANGDCDDSSGNWDEGLWKAYSYVVVAGASNKSSRLGEAWFPDSSIDKGSNLSSVDDGLGLCEQLSEGTTQTFKKFSAVE